MANINVNVAVEVMNNSDDNEKRIINNMQYALKMANSAVKKYNLFNKKDDIEAVALRALVLASNKYQNTEMPFITYAHAIIKNEIFDFINESQTIRVPRHTYFIKKIVDKYVENNPMATIEDIAQNTNFTITQVKNALRVKNSTVSMQTPIGEDDKITIEDEIASSMEAEKNHYYDDEIKLLHKNIANLPPEHQQVIKMYYGIGENAKTYEQIAQVLFKTRQRIHQIKEDAILELRAMY